MKQNKSSNKFENSAELVDFFKISYKSRYNKNLIVNRFKVKYYFLDVLEDFNLHEVKRLISHYFKVGSPGSHTINDFLSCYHELAESITSASEDIEERKRLRELTRKKVEEYRRGKQ